jgi:hypothetical protein
MVGVRRNNGLRRGTAIFCQGEAEIAAFNVRIINSMRFSHAIDNSGTWGSS